MTRRSFLLASGAAPLVSGVRARPTLCVFSKHLAKLNYEDLGRTAKQLGFEGVDLTVRQGGHVPPPRARQDMPRAVETIRSHGLTVPMVTTGLTSASDPTARPILQTAAHLSIPCFKLGYWAYGKEPVEARVAEVRREVQGLVSLAEEYRIQAGFHNHSGDYVGAALWDTREIIRDLDPRWIGYYFDPAHARIEGGLDGWEISQRLIMSRIKMVAIKDFYWEKDGGKWRERWCPLGEGMVDWAKVFAMFASAGYAGPLSLHLEYETPDEPAALGKDLEFLSKVVKTAYGA